MLILLSTFFFLFTLWLIFSDISVLLLNLLFSLCNVLLKDPDVILEVKTYCFEWYFVYNYLVKNDYNYIYFSLTQEYPEFIHLQMDKRCALYFTGKFSVYVHWGLDPVMS